VPPPVPPPPVEPPPPPHPVSNAKIVSADVRRKLAFIPHLPFFFSSLARSAAGASPFFCRSQSGGNRLSRRQVEGGNKCSNMSRIGWVTR
jgi:hypothetical protein